MIKCASQVIPKGATTLSRTTLKGGNTKGGSTYCTIDLLFDWFGISCMTTDNFCFDLQKRLIQTSQTGDQQYSDTSPSSIPCSKEQMNDTPFF
jgi:hypothetical protein